LLAGVFLFSALTKGTWSKERLVASGQTGVAWVPLPLLRAIAFSEALGVVGLIVPQLTGLVPA
jgi:DoxX-like family